MKDNLEQIKNKKNLKVFLITLLCVCPIVIGFNFLVDTNNMDNILVIFIDMILLLILSGIVYYIYYLIQKKKNQKPKEKKYDPFSDKMM